MKSILHVRPARLTDAPELLRWKNDAVTRQNAIVAKEPIAYEAHIAWLEECLSDKNRSLYVIDKDDKPAGDIRMDKNPQEIEISIRIAPECRGQGIGSRVLKSMCDEWQRVHDKPFVARILEHNAPSRKLFEKAGFKLIGNTDGILQMRRGLRVTAVLIKYKRLTELEAIKNHLLQFDFVDEILVHDNTRENIKTYGRYLTAARAANKTVYVQDDDCIIEDIEKLYAAYDGTGFVNGIKAERAAFYKGQDTLVGWGAFFRREWVKVLDQYVAMYGEDDMLHRDADRIFTCLLKVPKKTLEIAVKDFPSAMSSDAMSLEIGHESRRQAALERCRCILKGATIQ